MAAGKSNTGLIVGGLAALGVLAYVVKSRAASPEPTPTPNPNPPKPGPAPGPPAPASPPLTFSPSMAKDPTRAHNLAAHTIAEAVNPETGQTWTLQEYMSVTSNLGAALAFQEAAGIKVDGVYGPQTQAAFNYWVDHTS